MPSAQSHHHIAPDSVTLEVEQCGAEGLSSLMKSLPEPPPQLGLEARSSVRKPTRVLILNQSGDRENDDLGG